MFFFYLMTSPMAATTSRLHTRNSFSNIACRIFPTSLRPPELCAFSSGFISSSFPSINARRPLEDVAWDGGACKFFLSRAFTVRLRLPKAVGPLAIIRREAVSAVLGTFGFSRDGFSIFNLSCFVSPLSRFWILPWIPFLRPLSSPRDYDLTLLSSWGFGYICLPLSF